MTSPTHGSPIPPRFCDAINGRFRCELRPNHIGDHKDSQTRDYTFWWPAPPVGGATREPTDDSPNSLGPELAALRARDYRRINDPRSPVEAGAPGSAMQVHEQHEDRTENGP